MTAIIIDGICLFIGLCLGWWAGWEYNAADLYEQCATGWCPYQGNFAAHEALYGHEDEPVYAVDLFSDDCHDYCAQVMADELAYENMYSMPEEDLEQIHDGILAKSTPGFPSF